MLAASPVPHFIPGETQPLSPKSYHRVVPAAWAMGMVHGVGCGARSPLLWCRSSSPWHRASPAKPPGAPSLLEAETPPQLSPRWLCAAPKCERRESAPKNNAVGPGATRASSRLRLFLTQRTQQHSGGLLGTSSSSHSSPGEKPLRTPTRGLLLALGQAGSRAQPERFGRQRSGNRGHDTFLQLEEQARRAASECFPSSCSSSEIQPEPEKRA